LELSADVRTLSVKVESVSSTTSPFTATKQAADMTRNAKIDIPLMFAISCSFSDVFGKQIRSDGRVLLRDRNLQTNARVGTWLPRLLSFSLARLHCVSGTYQGFFLFSWWLKYFSKWLKYVVFLFFW
jgi:hypothetical protein